MFLPFRLLPKCYVHFKYTVSLRAFPAVHCCARIQVWNSTHRSVQPPTEQPQKVSSSPWADPQGRTSQGAPTNSLHTSIYIQKLFPLPFSTVTSLSAKAQPSLTWRSFCHGLPNAWGHHHTQFPWFSLQLPCLFPTSL